MDMGTTTPVPAWFANLPLSDPRCRNDSCDAFSAAHTASQTQISWASQFKYGKYTTWFYVAVLGIFVLVHLFNLYTDRKPHHGSPSVFYMSKAMIRFFSYRRFPGQVGVYLGLPSCGVILIVIVSFIASFAMSFAQRPYYRGNRLYGSPPLAVRSGLMAAALIPLTIALAGKVNLVTALTGIGHEKLNIFHRSVAWIMFGLSTVHTIPFFLQDSKDGLFQTKFYAIGSMEYTGVPPYALFFFLIAFSVPFLRRKFYEAFVYSHIVGAITFFGLCFWHFGNMLDSWYYLYGALAVWLIQLAGRTFWKTSTFKISEHWFEGLPTVARRFPGGMAKLQVLVPDEWTWKPGQHVFLRFPHLNPFDNHPFTIASIPARSFGVEKNSRNVMTFLIRGHDGSTKKLLSWLERNPDAQFSTIVDGPYGTVGRQYEHCADEVVLVAGGNGITACLPFLQRLSKAIQRGICTTRMVKLVWVVRNRDDVVWVAEELREAIAEAPAESVTADIYVTDESESIAELPKGVCDSKQVANASAGSTSSSSLSIGVSGLRTHYDGRPNLPQLIPQLVGSMRTAVIGCGPESLKIDLCNTVAQLQSKVFMREAVEISLHTETFEW